tara:strand:+ start:377 stop:808 length:432 start_codon:yes stop_codon:yes gene_type:complete
MLTLDKLLVFKVKNTDAESPKFEKITLKIISLNEGNKTCQLEIGFDDETYKFEGILKKNIVQIKPYNIESEHKEIIDEKCKQKNCEKISELLKIKSQVRAMLMFQNNKLLNMSSFYIKDNGQEEWERFTLEMVEKSTNIIQEI